MKALYFLHIPKTAGSSMRSLLDMRFAPEDVAPVDTDTQNLPAYLLEEPQRLNGYRFLRGHMGYSPVQYFSEKPDIVVFLRDPVERTLSHYGHILRQSDHWIHSLLPKPDLSLEEFLAFPQARALVTNFQARHLAQDFDFLHPITDPCGQLLKPNLGLLLSCFRFPGTDRELLRKAKKRLNECAFVGITERFAESTQLLCVRLGWEHFPGEPSLNRAPSRLTQAEISPATLADIQSLTAVDNALYRGALRNFLIRWRLHRLRKKMYM